MTNEPKELSLEVLEQVSGSGGGVRVRQTIDGPPQKGGSYNGDNFDTDPVSGGYMGDGNYLRPL